MGSCTRNATRLRQHRLSSPSYHTMPTCGIITANYCNLGVQVIDSQQLTHSSSSITIVLHYNTMRYYDAELGRYVNRDLIGEDGGLILYGFVDNSPFSGFDPYGLDSTISNDPWGLLGYYAIGLRNNLNLNQNAINILKQDSTVASWERELQKGAYKQMDNTSCGSSGIHARQFSNRGFSPSGFNQTGRLASTGRWQFFALGYCTWQCSSRVALDCSSKPKSCCSCVGSCSINYTINKTYTFRFTREGNQMNREVSWFAYWYLRNLRLGIDPKYNISGQWKNTISLVGRHCN